MRLLLSAVSVIERDNRKLMRNNKEYFMRRRNADSAALINLEIIVAVRCLTDSVMYYIDPSEEYIKYE